MSPKRAEAERIELSVLLSQDTRFPAEHKGTNA